MYLNPIQTDKEAVIGSLHRILGILRMVGKLAVTSCCRKLFSFYLSSSQWHAQITARASSWCPKTHEEGIDLARIAT